MLPLSSGRMPTAAAARRVSAGPALSGGGTERAGAMGSARLSARSGKRKVLHSVVGTHRLRFVTGLSTWQANGNTGVPNARLCGVICKKNTESLRALFAQKPGNSASGRTNRNRYRACYVKNLGLIKMVSKRRMGLHWTASIRHVEAGSAA